MKLEAFFRAVVPLLLGQSGVEEFEEAVGPIVPPPRGTTAARVAFYQRLVRRDTEKVLESLYGPVRAACALVDGSPWETLIRDYVAENRPSAWDLNAVGDRFPEYLHGRRTRAEGSTQPIWIEELADLCWALYEVKVRVGEHRPEAVNPAIEIREHSHQVRAFFHAVRRGGEELSPPKEGVEISILYREPETLRGRVVGPSVPMLVALVWLLGELEEEELRGTGLSAEALGEGLRELKRFGIVGPELDPIWPL